MQMAAARYYSVLAGDNVDVLANFEDGDYDVIIRTGSAGYASIGGADVGTGSNFFILKQDQEYRFSSIRQGQLFLRNLDTVNPTGIGVFAVATS